MMTTDYINDVVLVGGAWGSTRASGDVDSTGLSMDCAMEHI